VSLLNEQRLKNYTREVVALVDRLKPLLAGRSPAIQGAALADLLAIWLAGHHLEGDADATRKMREELLTFHIGQVRETITINERILNTTPATDR
jgi:hypothetical protein